MNCFRGSNQEGYTSWGMVRPTLVSHSMGSMYVHWLFRFKSQLCVNQLDDAGLAPPLRQ